MGQRVTVDEDDGDDRSLARRMAGELARGFRAHDRGFREKAVDAFAFVDEHQFAHLDEQEARLAATAFVDALWAKDEIEFQYLRNGELDADGLAEADYSPVREKLRRRAALLGADSDYAATKAEAWRHHKAGGDYWTPFQRSQVYELRAALGEPSYPDKPRAGQSGPGPEPLRYVLAFELHDMHTDDHWEQGERVLVPYFRYILERQ